jgi:DNA polymerase-3 subunit delta
MKQAQALINSIKKRDFKPVYFLVGERETYFVDLIAEALEQHVLTEDEKAFNQNIVYGKDVSIDEVISLSKRFPMMAEYQLVIVREAQSLAKQLQQLETYLEQPQETTILVFCYKYKKPDARKKVVKLLKKHHVYFETPAIYDNQVPDWISQTMTSAGYSIDHKAAVMLVEFLGVNLAHISKELEKLIMLIPKGHHITPEIIEENIGISKDFNNFELTKAIGLKNEPKAYQIINYFAQNPKNNPLVVTTGQLFSYFQKLAKYHALKDKSKMNAAKKLGISPYFVSEYVAAAQKYPLKKVTRNLHHIKQIDLMGKGVDTYQTSQGDLLKELMVKLMR